MSAVNVETGELPDTINYEVHPVAALFPFIEGESFREFVEDIRMNGQRDPVVLDAQDRLLDGRNRVRACQALGIDVKETRYSGDDAEAWIISHNVHRRHMTTSQRAMVAARLATLKHGSNQYAPKVEGSFEPSTDPHKVERSAPAIVDAAAQLNVARESVKRGRSVIESGDADLIKSVESGETSVTKAARQIKARAEDVLIAKTGPPTASRQDRADLITELAAQGYSSRQMPNKVGVSEESVRQIARDFDIEIPADKSQRGTRRIDSSQLVENTATALEGLVMGVELINHEDVDPAVASQWADSLDDSLKKLRSFATQIRKATQ